MYKPHKLALLLPPMAADQREELKQDIAANGLVDSITLFEGKILDGVHRDAICREAGVLPRYEEYTGDSPVAFVAAKNIHRRHLTPSQRNAIGAELIPLFQAEAKARMEQGARNQASARVREPRKAAKDAADVVGGSERGVEDARYVQREDPQAFEAQKAGKISGKEATRRARDKKEKKDTRAGRKGNWNGKTNASRERELHARKRSKQKQPDKYLELLRLNMDISKMTRILEGWHVHEFNLDEESMWLMADIHDDLISLGEWHDRTLSSVQAWLLDVDVREKIAKLRDTRGRTEEEAETALRLADRLERKLEARLTQ